MGIQFLSLGALLLAFLPAGLAQQSATPDSSAPQAAAQTTTAQPAPAKTKRVWTDDNIGQVRTPEDVYLDQKRAAEELARQKKEPAPEVQANATKPGARGPIVLKIPDTADETQKAIAQRQAMFDNFTNLLGATQKQLDGETNPTVRATLEQKAGLLQGDVADTRSDLDKLQKHLAELEAEKKAGGSGSPDSGQQ